ncbi:hypothetical protein ABFY41_11075 [Acinetobacter haemolyticus]|uniref:hypothetical protein n=1 Tax=Acinetobacter haemolyticus TaxID=29430 RepID=UPI003D1A6359
MEQNVLNHNSSYTFRKSLLVSCAAMITGFGIFTGAYALVTKPPVESPIYSYANTQSTYGLLAVQITSESTGQAVFNLDGFRVFASFEFERIIESNGALGGDLETIFIKSLAVDQVFDANGNNYNDFTNADDIRNMISIVSAHIAKNKMMEAI